MIWMLVLLSLAVVVTLSAETGAQKLPILAGAIRMTSPLWLSGLLLLVLAGGLLLSIVIRIPENSSNRSIVQLELLWVALVTICNFWWFCGNWTLLHTQPSSSEFHFGQQTFIYLSVAGQSFTLLFLLPNRWAILGAILIGFTIPLYSFREELFSYPDRYVTQILQLFCYCVAGIIVSIGYRRARVGEILLENERSRAEAELARANTFIASISHDLRQPLTALSLDISSLQSQAESDEMRATVKGLRRHTETIEMLVRGTLDLARLQAGTWKVDLCDIALPNLVEKIGADLRPAAEAAGISLHVKSVPYLVRSDPTALDRIIRNLLGNSLRYTPPKSNGRKGEIALDCELHQNTIRVNVKDNGIGIPKDRIGDVFKEYVQLDNSERDSRKGLGLGLSIVQGLAKLLDHELAVESQPGVGSVFSVTVPCVAKIPAELLPYGEFSEPESSLDGMTVILVDDDQDVRTALRRRLVGRGVSVVEGECAEDVVSILRHNTDLKPNFLLCDYRLRKGLTGVQVVESVRGEIDPSLPAAIWTAETLPDILQAIERAGLRRFSKPVIESELIAELARHRHHAS